MRFLFVEFMIRSLSLANRWLDRDFVWTRLVLVVHLCVVYVKLDNFAVLGPVFTLHLSFRSLRPDVVLLGDLIAFSCRPLIPGLGLPFSFDPLLGFLSPDLVFPGSECGSSVGPNLVKCLVLRPSWLGRGYEAFELVLEDVDALVWAELRLSKSSLTKNVPDEIGLRQGPPSDRPACGQYVHALVLDFLY